MEGVDLFSTKSSKKGLEIIPFSSERVYFDSHHREKYHNTKKSYLHRNTTKYEPTDLEI